MSGSALEGGAIFESERQAAIRVGCGVVQQAAPELFTEGGDLAVLLPAASCLSLCDPLYLLRGRLSGDGRLDR